MKGATLLILIFSFMHWQVYSQYRYKGGPKHAAPRMDVLPDSGNYNIHTPVTGALNDSLHKQVQTLFTMTGMPGITAAMLLPGKGLWQMDSGFISLPDQLATAPQTVFYWCSVGKLITATIIGVLVQENKLDYNSPLSRWFPQIQDADKITIDALLKHTSGIYSFNADSTFHYSHRYYAPQELITLAMSRRNLFPPGQYWSYSNTGYLLLALIAEKVTQKTYAGLVQEKIAGPLQLSSLRALLPRELPSNLALAHEHGRVAEVDYSLPSGAGNIVSNAKDMVVLLYALLSGKIGSLPFTYDRIRDLYPMYEKGMYYGRGMMLFDFKAISQTEDTWIGHSGGTENYRAIVLYDTGSKAFVAVAVNAHVPVEAIVRKLLEAIH